MRTHVDRSYYVDQYNDKCSCINKKTTFKRVSWWSCKDRYSWRWIKLCPYLYLLSRRGLALTGGGEALRSESDSDTGLRGREAEEVGRELVQLGSAGEDRGLGSVDIPERDLQREQKKKFVINSLFDICCIYIHLIFFNDLSTGMLGHLNWLKVIRVKPLK